MTRVKLMDLTTACARIAVWSVIFNLKDNYIYCDTDSVKFKNPEKHLDFLHGRDQMI